ncbi:lipopolysaccharide heptosyltransferase I [Parahaliea aestuarii]|uniref:Lipopolysaccharide heptosyltransferase 1 n=1 Tax=Parahaliea aestuarii TaxID=1852021 RepID=A0A5C8ZXE2_9GAMM|nr:lipopolysaccharide heptosyltransferase I [Parahaliea aestuarii]TXS92272.1 lipopolysaccharide heptosyltransferase I [Parahaliea aestuarii]
MRVLIVKMSSLGDVIHTLPALTDAARAIPGIQFDWVVEEGFAEIPAWHPAVDRVIPVALRRWRKTPLQSFGGAEWRRFRSELARHHYAAVIDAQGLMKSAFITRLVKAPRFGYDRDSARERLAAKVYHHRIPVPRELHAVERTRRLFAAALNYALPETKGDYGVRQHLVAGAHRSQRSLLFFHGTARDEKLWPEAHWIELAALAANADYQVNLPWGSEKEKSRAQRIAEQSPNARLLPRLDLLGLAGMLLEVDGAVAVDTGLGHLSAALDVPSVSLYGPTRTSLIGAYGHNQVHIQSPVGPGQSADPVAMMASITPAMVWQSLLPLLPEG